MKRQTNIILQDESSYALNSQSKISQYDFPFTLNPTIGCFFGCKYCYSPWVAYGWKKDRKHRFFETIHVKLDKPAHLAKELPRYSSLPKHMKRVQINETSEYYLPQLLLHLKKEKQPDLLLGILAEFEKAWNSGNNWMLHILTKSHLILNHLEVLKRMNHMVQVEVSFATHDERKKKQLEYFTPSIQRRLELVDELASAGLFVRIMAMPFYGERDDLLKLKEEVFKRGAKAFKNKGINYYEWSDLEVDMSFEEFITGKIKRSKGREDKKDETLIIKSGEYVKSRKRTVLFPEVDENFKATEKWSAMTMMQERFSRKTMKIIDSGYRDCNNEDWGYII